MDKYMFQSSYLLRGNLACVCSNLTLDNLIFINTVDENPSTLDNLIYIDTVHENKLSLNRARSCT